MEKGKLYKVKWKEVEDDKMIKSRKLKEEVESIEGVGKEIVKVKLNDMEKKKEDENLMKQELKWKRDDKNVKDEVLEYKYEMKWRRGKKKREEEKKKEKNNLKKVRKEINNKIEKKEKVELKNVNKESKN